ncbi:ABC transporter substrate-binding protein [Pokkaliibacter sp. MBI-7]|uniref:ABC transporter substrate-binding protein n=1 Tax=Pokkaliibacter sp. MBI-7 TaxID=3040600 RepID=UPI0024481775|nr:ABC transporter substrate-binding protein [Pokkaliibacter sp. MBI-7]MDH2434866.1 ABC transporter substrate-binding protein [Pokkaliibacter sp. MBI-7]
MLRRHLLTLLLLATAITSTSVATAATAAEAKVPRIVMLLWRGETPVEQGFKTYFHDHQRQAQFEEIDLQRDLSRLPVVLEQIKQNPPDLVYTWGTGVTLGTVGRWDESDPAKLHDIPVVFSMVSAPWKTGIAAPEGQQRANVTGASHIAPLATQLKAMSVYMPVQRLGVIFTPTEPNSVSSVNDLEQATQAAGIQLLQAPVPNLADGTPDPASIPALVAKLAEQGANVIYIGPDNFVGTYRQQLTSAALAHGIPCFTGTELEIRDGDAMFGLVSRYDLVGRLAASKAEKILFEGQSAANIPIETLNRFSYLIKMPVARRLQLYPPVLLLDYAEVLQ